MAKRRKPGRKKPSIHRNRPAGKAAPAGLQLMNFAVTWDVMPDEKIDSLPAATRNRMQEIFDIIYDEPDEVIGPLRELVAAYPDIPCFQNWLISSLRNGSDDADRNEALKMAERLFQEQPNYFFARTTLADIWIAEGKYDRAAALLFGPEHVLTRLYPGRKAFHISEIRHWAYVSGRTLIGQGDMEGARIYRNLLAEIEPHSKAVEMLDLYFTEDLSTLGNLLSRHLKKKAQPGRGTGRSRPNKLAPAKKSGNLRSKSVTEADPDQPELF
jgi:hypothetical protein